MEELKLKVCGMKDPENIAGLVQHAPDFIGFIFYEKSPRFAGELDAEYVAKISSGLKKVGVFVNEELGDVLSAIGKYQLDYVQLHGDEDVSYVRSLKANNIGVIKVFRVSDELPEELSDYVGLVDYFLFDTATKNYGGSGKHFDWDLLKKYDLATPYLLSGGISVDDIEAIKKMELKGLVGIDVNSKFELSPGLKDLDQIKKLREVL